MNTPNQQTQPGSSPEEDNLEAPIALPTANVPAVPPPKRRWRLVVIAGIALVAVVVAGLLGYMYLTRNATPAQVKIGFMMPQTEGAASMGLGAIKGVQLALKQLGVTNVEIVQADSKCDPAVSPKAIKQLIDQGVIAIIGDGCSSSSIAALPEANAAKIPMISPSASSPQLSIPNDYFFRVIPPDDYQASYLAEHVYKQGIRTVGEFYTDEPAGANQARIFKETFERLGGKVVTQTSAEAHIIALSTQAKALKASNPQAVVMTANTVTSAIALINLLAEQGYQGKLFGSDAMYDKTLITNSGKNAEGMTVSTFTLGTKSFRQSMASTYQSADLAYAAPQAYDALRAIVDAIKDGAKTGEDVKNALSKTSFDGVSGYHIQFDKNGEITGDVKYSLLQIKDGDFTEIEQ